jgi:hypothetical protein
MSCHGCRGAFQHHEVNIGWRLGEALRETKIRTKPGAGTVLRVMEQGDRCGIQTVRNPQRKARPVTRRPVTGAGEHEYIWVYARKSGKTGWVRSDHILRTGPIDPEHPLGGPTEEHLDFEVGVTKPKKKGRSSCGRLSATRPRKTVMARDLHLRYSPGGTSFHYLHEGDEVKVLLEGARAFCFVVVLHAAADGSAHKNTRGWVLATSLG